MKSPQTSGRQLTKNTFYNLLGQGLPLVAAVFAIPFVIDGFGIDRFGLLTLAWALVGYFSLFDLGLGRGLTKLVSGQIGRSPPAETGETIYTALLMMGGLALLAMLLLLGLAEWLIYDVIAVAPALREEVLTALRLLTVILPFSITGAGMRGVLEAHQMFSRINLVRVPIALMMFAGPLVVLPFSTSLVAIIAALAVVRVLEWSILLLLMLDTVPQLKRSFHPRRRWILPLLRLGGWMTVSNVIGPIMQYMDRFIIAALVTTAAVAHYTTPYEVITKMGLASLALTRVLFPAFSASYEQDPGRTTALYQGGLKITLLGLFPISLAVVALAPFGLDLWLGAEFAAKSTVVLQWLTVGVFINATAHLPFTLIQSMGRPDLTAKLHLAELPLYLAMVWWVTDRYGIQGTAMVWTARVLVDAAVLHGIAVRMLPRGATLAPALALGGGALAALLAAMALPGLGWALGVVGLGSAAWALLGYLLLLSAAEKKFLRRLLRPPKSD